MDMFWNHSVMLVPIDVGASSGFNSEMGSAGFEPATSSARGWHHTKLDYDPIIKMMLFYIRIILNHRYTFLLCDKIMFLIFNFNRIMF